jgi:hypothetical protein
LVIFEVKYALGIAFPFFHSYTHCKQRGDNELTGPNTPAQSRQLQECVVLFLPNFLFFWFGTRDSGEN